jgi:hypothetical protein
LGLGASNGVIVFGTEGAILKTGNSLRGGAGNVGSESELGCNRAGECNGNSGWRAKVVCDISSTEGSTITSSGNDEIVGESLEFKALEHTPHRS